MVIRDFEACDIDGENVLLDLVIDFGDTHTNVYVYDAGTHKECDREFHDNEISGWMTYAHEIKKHRGERYGEDPVPRSGTPRIWENHTRKADR